MWVDEIVTLYRLSDLSWPVLDRLACERALAMRVAARDRFGALLSWTSCWTYSIGGARRSLEWAACCSILGLTTLVSKIWTQSCSDLIAALESFTEVIAGVRVTRGEREHMIIWCTVELCTALLQSGQAAVSLKVFSTSVLDSLTSARCIAGSPSAIQVHRTRKWTHWGVVYCSC